MMNAVTVAANWISTLSEDAGGKNTVVLVVNLEAGAGETQLALLQSHRVGNTAILQELLHTRDWLCLQLEHAHGMLDDEEFDARAEPFWVRLKEQREFDAASHLFGVLADVTDGLEINAADLAIILRCSLSTANRLVREANLELPEASQK